MNIHPPINALVSALTACSPFIGSRRSSLSLLDSPSPVSPSSSFDGVWPDFFFKSLTASFEVVPKIFAFDLRRALQVGQALISGRLHSRWNECPKPQKCAIMDCHGCTPSYHICSVNRNMRYKNYIYFMQYTVHEFKNYT